MTILESCHFEVIDSSSQRPLPYTFSSRTFIVPLRYLLDYTYYMICYPNR